MHSISPKRLPESPTPEALRAMIGSPVTVHGIIHKVRQMRGFSFVLLRTPRDVLQCVTDGTCELAEGTSVRIEGDVLADERSKAGFEIRIREMEILGVPSEPLPFPISGREMNVSLETMLDHRAITLRNIHQRAIFQLQDGLCTSMRGYLKRNGFTEIHTPKLITGGVEGGANQFELPYFGQTAYLAQSPQCYKQMMVPVFERVFDVGPVFRAEKHDTSRHLNEYTSFDLEMGFPESLETLLELETDMLREALKEVSQNDSQELALLEVKLPTITGIPSIRFAEAKARLWPEGDPNLREDDLSPDEEKRLCAHIEAETGSEFVFVTHYPSSKRPFYTMDDPENPAETLTYDLLFRGLEITTGGLRIHDAQMQIKKMLALGMNIDAFSGYLSMHRAGMPPHGGMGIGLERLTARLLDLPNIRYTTLFPRDTHRLRP